MPKICKMPSPRKSEVSRDDTHRQVSRQIRLITYQRRLVTGHTNENRNDANRIDQREQADKKNLK